MTIKHRDDLLKENRITKLEQHCKLIENKLIEAISNDKNVIYYHLGYDNPDIEEDLQYILKKQGYEISYIDPVDNVYHINF
mgnify:CR=1 FL=1